MGGGGVRGCLKGPTCYLVNSLSLFVVVGNIIFNKIKLLYCQNQLLYIFKLRLYCFERLVRLG